MSALYRVEVRALEGPKVDLWVQPTQPDCCPFYMTARFAMGLLVDAPAGSRFTYNPASRMAMLGRAWGGTLLRNAKLWNKGVYDSYRVPVHPLRDLLDDRTCDLGSAADFDCSKYIVETRVLQVSGPRWDYGMPDPWALYRLTASHERWLANLTEASAWDSVAYDYDEPAPFLNLCEDLALGAVVDGSPEFVDDQAFLSAF